MTLFITLRLGFQYFSLYVCVTQYYTRGYIFTHLFRIKNNIIVKLKLLNIFYIYIQNAIFRVILQYLEKQGRQETFVFICVCSVLQM